MTLKIVVPDLPESVNDATVATWHKQPGDFVQQDEVIVDIETDKVVLEVPASESGVLEEILQEEGATVLAKQDIAIFRPEAAPAAAPAPAATAAAQQAEAPQHPANVHPSARRLLSENNMAADGIQGTGVGGGITRQDVANHLQKPSQPTAVSATAERSETRVPMTRLRKRIGERLLESTHNTAMLTTFNEVNLKPIMTLRKMYQEKFEKRHGVRLGFMSFYVKAVVEALKRYPEVNASIDGDDIIYHNYFDISIAVSTPRGLVTPVLRDCDMMSIAEIEKEIQALAEKGREGKLSIEELTGGNFTITNGGVFGSLLSTPIINPPQSAVLGMHKIQDRPVAVNGQVEILPMMYLALSYDHCIVDGKESVSFLVTIKEMLEDPARLLLDV